MVVHVCNPILGRQKLEDHQLEVSLGYIVSSKASLGYKGRTCSKRKNGGEDKMCELVFDSVTKIKEEEIKRFFLEGGQWKQQHIQRSLAEDNK
jgi:hypothetical protein